MKQDSAGKKFKRRRLLAEKYSTPEAFFSACRVAVVDALNNYASFENNRSRTKEEIATLLALRWKPKDPTVDEAVDLIRGLRSAENETGRGMPVRPIDALRLGIQLQTFLEASRGFEEGSECRLAYPLYKAHCVATGREPSASWLLKELHKEGAYWGKLGSEKTGSTISDVSFAQVYQRWRARWRFWGWLDLL